MTRKFGAARRAAFFRALAETGNQTIAAERAKVSRSWVTLHRSSDPEFRARMDAARAEAAERLRGAAGVEPAAGWRHQAGEELAVRGTNGRVTQVARARLKQWTPRVEARFLAELATCCNVKRACAAAGLSQVSAYNHRQRWPAFAERWDAALEEGYDRLATALVASAGAMLGDTELIPEPLMGPMTVDQVLQLLRLHRARVDGVGRRPGLVRRPRTLEELRPSILAKFELVERKYQAKMTPEQREARERELARLSSAGGER